MEDNEISLRAILEFLGDAFGEPEIYDKFFVYVISFGGGQLGLFDDGKGIAVTTERDPTKVDIARATKTEHWHSNKEKSIIKTVDLCSPNSFEEIKQTLARELGNGRRR
jgi:hypothetical protein